MVNISAPRVRITYTVGNNSLKPARKLEIGQWWLYRDAKSWDWPDLPNGITNLRTGLSYVPKQICAVVITDLTPGVYGGEEVKVEFMLADPQHAPYEQNDTAWFIDQNFDETEGYFSPFWDPTDGFVYKNNSVQAQIQYGIDCTKCKKHYPYAVRAANFECWACRNGF